MSRTWRLFLAGITTLSLHTIILCWPITSDKTILPAPLAVQRIAVSLGTKPTVKQTKPKSRPEKAPTKTNEVLPQTQTETVSEPEPTRQQPPTPTATPEPRPQPRPKPQEKQKTPPPPPVRPPQNQAVSPRQNPSSPKSETRDEEQENSQTDSAAHIIQRATPLYQVNPPPRYPRLARRRGLQGVVMLEALVSEHGSVKELRIARSSGHSILDRAAIKAVQSWRFSAGSIGGKPQQMRVQVPIRFRLQ